MSMTIDIVSADAYRREIEGMVTANRATVIEGPTGSGKTTRIPPFLYEGGYAGARLIGVMEPRRIAAISTAEFVALRYGCRVGEEIGYQIRFDDTTREGTRIKYMTDGILLQEAKSDPLFSRYGVLVFDEAHERGINSDFGLGLAKRAMKAREDLKVVVMSATMDAAKYAAFLETDAIVRVEGRMYPVEERFLEQEDIEAAYAKFRLKEEKREAHLIEALAAHMVEKIHRTDGKGDILIFMPGEAEIFRTIRFIEELGMAGMSILPIYGNMSPDEQRRIFESVSGRKVIVATNIAETSITVPGVRHVVDSGLIKESGFDPRTGIGSLKVVEHSRAGLEQRKGRAGRLEDGICWRLFRKENYEVIRPQYRRNQDEVLRPEYTKPEIQRSDLAGVVLRLLGLGIKDVENFELPDPLPKEAVRHALETLEAIGAMSKEREVTEIGEKILELPLEPRIGRMILAAEEFGCVDEMMTIAAKLSVRDVFVRPRDKEKEEEADRAKMRFCDRRSDFLTLLTVVKMYEQSGRSRDWASANFLNWKALDEILDIRGQIQEILERQGVNIGSAGYLLPKNQNALTAEEEAQGDAIGKALAAGLIQNIAFLRGLHSYERNDDEVYIHPSSVLMDEFDPPIIMSASVVKTKRAYARDCGIVKERWLEEIAPQATRREIVGPQKKYSSDEGEYEVFERFYFQERLVSEKSVTARGPLVTRKIAQDIMTGKISFGCQILNAEVLRKVEQIYLQSGEKTKKPFTSMELEEFYVERLGDAATVEEAAVKNLVLDIREFVSKEEAEEFLPKAPHTKHYMVEPPPAPRPAQVVLAPPQVETKIDKATQERLTALRKDTDAILRNPSIYGYEEGYGLRSKAYMLLGEVERLERMYEMPRWSTLEEREEKLGGLEEKIQSAYAFREKREQNTAKKIAKKEEEAKRQKDRERLEQEWKEYQTRAITLQQDYKGWPGLGIYTFPVDNRGDPQDYREKDGRMYRFDWENTQEVLPEEGKSYWGYVTQWGDPSLVALLCEVVPQPAHLRQAKW